MQSSTIGKIARQAQIGIETIRFYERNGLIEEPPRSASGYRQYPSGTVDRLRFIKRAKEIGFSLKEIRELLNLRLDGEVVCDEVRLLAEAKIADIEEKIALLQRMRGTLGELVVACKSNEKTELCPILRAIKKEDRS